MLVIFHWNVGLVIGAEFVTGDDDDEYFFLHLAICSIGFHKVKDDNENY